MRDQPTLPTLLLAVEDPQARAAMAEALEGMVECLEASAETDALVAVTEHFVQVLIVSGSEADHLARTILARWPETSVIAVGEDIAEAQQLSTAWTPAQLTQAVATATRLFQLNRENERLRLEARVRTPARSVARATEGFEDLPRVATSPLEPLIDRARQFASFDVPVLLTGEPGTGRAAFAEAMHRASLRSDRPFEAFDCTGLADTTVATALFGSPNPDAGLKLRNGLVRRAEAGTLYLHGVDTLSRAMQLRLLRLVTDQSYERPGSGEILTTTVRLMVGATDLQALTHAGTFRADLYFALAVAELTLPPLRERRMDIPVLARDLLSDAARRHRKTVHGLSDAALTFLEAHDWPGNLPELEAEITRMLIVAQRPVLGPELISRHILQAVPDARTPCDADIMAARTPLKDRVEAMEARILRETLTRLEWNKSRSAEELGLSRVGLRAKLDRYGIHDPQTEEV